MISSSRESPSGDGYIVSYGDALYRSMDAVRRLREQGVNVGLVNKWHVNVADEPSSVQREKHPFFRHATPTKVMIHDHLYVAEE